MTEKRFELKWRDTGEVLYDNETGLEHGIYSPNYRFHVRDMMNELVEENKTLQKQKQELLKNYAEISTALELTIKEKNNILHTIQETYETERTALGKSTLKQLAESLGVEVYE